MYAFFALPLQVLGSVQTDFHSKPGASYQDEDEETDKKTSGWIQSGSSHELSLRIHSGEAALLCLANPAAQDTKIYYYEDPSSQNRR
jgi:nitrate reductase beta subunit